MLLLIVRYIPMCSTVNPKQKGARFNMEQTKKSRCTWKIAVPAVFAGLTAGVFITLMLCVGCTTVKMSVEYPSVRVKASQDHCYTVDAHGSFWNTKGKSLQKGETHFPATMSEAEQAGYVITNGTDFVGDGYNKSVTYHITYWDSLLAVLSFGTYVPMRIEYLPVEPKNAN